MSDSCPVWRETMKQPTLEQRATFLSIFLGMAKEYGYTLPMLMRDVRAGWKVAKAEPQRITDRENERA